MITESIKNRQQRYWEIRNIYNENEKNYKYALKQALRDLRILKNSSKAYLRIAYIDGRVKELPSLIRKAYEKQISIDNVFDYINDILGFRIIINNLKDITPVIQELEKHQNFKIIRSENHSDGPYRAVHLKANYLFENQNEKNELSCEIQIRTLLQDAWAILTHHDIYRNQANLPDLAKIISDNLSQLLASLDSMADDFRKQIEKEVQPPNDLSDNSPLDEQGMAFLYYELFGKIPQEFEIKYLLKIANELGLKTIGEAREVLKSEVLEKLQKIHDTRFPEIQSRNDLMEYGMQYAVSGSDSFTSYKTKIEEEWAEIDQWARDEILSELPSTYDEFIEELNGGSVSWEAIKELAEIRECGRCGGDIFIPDTTAENISEHYSETILDCELEIILETVNPPSFPEPASVNSPNLCPYCDHIMSKDD